MVARRRNPYCDECIECSFGEGDVPPDFNNKTKLHLTHKERRRRRLGQGHKRKLKQKNKRKPSEGRRGSLSKDTRRRSSVRVGIHPHHDQR